MTSGAATVGYVRHRIRSGPPAFNPGCTPRLDVAYFDKVALRCHVGDIEARDRDARHSFYRALGETSLLRCSGPPRALELSVRSGWLFSGRLVLHVHDHGASCGGRIRADLKLNPTRMGGNRIAGSVELAPDSFRG